MKNNSLEDQQHLDDIKVYEGCVRTAGGILYPGIFNKTIVAHTNLYGVEHGPLPFWGGEPLPSGSA